LVLGESWSEDGVVMGLTDTQIAQLVGDIVRIGDEIKDDELSTKIDQQHAQADADNLPACLTHKLFFDRKDAGELRMANLDREGTVHLANPLRQATGAGDGGQSSMDIEEPEVRGVSVPMEPMDETGSQISNASSPVPKQKFKKAPATLRDTTKRTEPRAGGEKQLATILTV